MLVTISYVLLLLTLSESVSLGANKVNSDQTNCVKCHTIDDNKINVHLVPHSHDDVGWLKTVDQYYYGMRSDIQQASVQYIITSVVEALLDNPDRRYIQVETAFFWKWWQSQNDDMREKFRYLVNNGQIEMVNGAWSMNDEACVNYQSTVDQFTWGLRILNDTLGTCGVPRVGWQIDPFGHSREQASLFSQLGFDGVFFARLDHDEKIQRQVNATLDFAWQGSANLDDSIIFGGIFPTSLYFPPNGYCWDWGCNDDPVIDDKTSPDYNADRLVENFIDIINVYKEYYPTNNIFIPMGGDFQYEAADMNYINMDRFIRAFKDNEDVNVIYSTPSCYIQAVHAAKPQLQLKTTDFFPYSNDPNSFWTGYFTSRPNSKRFERQGHNILQASKQLMVLNSLHGASYEDNTKPLRNLREVMGILQHHDAITGTEKQHVANDYVRLLTKAIETAERPLGQVIQNLLKVNKTEDLDIDLKLSSCLLTNVSICTISQQNKNFVVAVYNPLSWNVTHHIRLPVNGTTFDIEGPDGKEEFDVVSPMPYFSTRLDDLQGKLELVFAARDVPPMGIKLYYVVDITTDSEDYIVLDDEGPIYGNDETNFEIDEDTNLLKSVTMNGITLNITQNFYYYYSETGEKDLTNIASGAYLFRPTNTTPEYLTGKVINAAAVKGKVVDEFHQQWSDDKVNVSQIIRVYKGENYIEFDWLVGGIDVNKDNMGKEVITKYTVTSSFKNNGTFYTDSNGREMMKRTINSRPDYTYDPKYEPVASNYYPVTSKIVIKDDDSELAILTDRSEGGSSLKDGEIELMLHRRIINDDNKGVDESLDETDFGTGIYVRGTHYLIIGSPKNLNPDGKTTAAQERILAQKKLVQPWIGLGNTTETIDKLREQLKFNYSALRENLPENTNILTFEPWKEDKTYILRLEHILEKDEDPSLSNAATLELAELFQSFVVDDAKETTLGANQLLEDFQSKGKYAWNITGEKMDVVPNQPDPSRLSITLTPMKIRTFIVTLNDAHNRGLKNQPFALVLVLGLIAYFFK